MDDWNDSRKVFPLPAAYILYQLAQSALLVKVILIKIRGAEWLDEWRVM
jgi:hypothetical protein